MRSFVRLLARFVVVATAVGAACTVAPAAGTPPATIATGVTVAGTDLGGLSFSAARQTLREDLARPLVFSHGKRRWRVSVDRFGHAVDVDEAVTAALRAGPHAEVEAGVWITPGRVASYVAAIASEVDLAARDARLAGLENLRPRIEPAAAGREVVRARLIEAIRRALIENERPVITVPVRRIEPAVRAGDIGSIVVVRRESKTLQLYDGTTLVRSFPIATGTAEFPTPLGQFAIADMQRDPWWYPPPSDWAKDLEPVPPGPGNPLGTRWMGLDRYMVGIHGTPDAASIGYSASHGCVRMFTWDAAWLFDRVRHGTPVFIVSA